MLDPVLFHLGPLAIHWYGVLYVLAFSLGYYLVKKLHKEFGISWKDAEDFCFYVLVAIVVGARLFEVLFYDPSYYFSNPWKIFAVWEGGLASHGALIALVLVTYYFSQKRSINFWSLADLFTIPIALGASFVRVGNFINQELVGRVTQVPWAVNFDRHEGLRHPVQLYQAASNFFIFLVLFFVRQSKKKPGFIFSLFLLLYSASRFFLEFFKDLPADYGFFLVGMNLAQWANIVLFIVGVFIYRKIMK